MVYNQVDLTHLIDERECKVDNYGIYYEGEIRDLDVNESAHIGAESPANAIIEA